MDAEQLLDDVLDQLAGVPRPPSRRERPTVEPEIWPPPEYYDLDEDKQALWFERWLELQPKVVRTGIGGTKSLSDDDVDAPAGRFPELDAAYKALPRKKADADDGSVSLPEFRQLVWSAVDSGGTSTTFKTVSSDASERLCQANLALSFFIGVTRVAARVQPKLWTLLLSSLRFSRPIAPSPTLREHGYKVHFAAQHLLLSLEAIQAEIAPLAQKVRGRPVDERTERTIGELAKLWFRLTGKKAASSRGGPFARFALAAWIEFQVPFPPRKACDEWLFSEIERRLRKKKGAN